MYIKNLSTSLKYVYSFINQGHYKVAIKEMMGLIEQILRSIYEDIYLRLPLNVREGILNYEKTKQRSIDKMSLGELIGLYRSNQILKEYQRIYNKEFWFQGETC